MKNTIFEKYNLLKFLVISLSLISSNVHADFLTPEEIEEAKALAKSTKQCDFSPVEETETDLRRGQWLTLESFDFSGFTKTGTFYVANSINRNGLGEIALYSIWDDPTKINLSSAGAFNDLHGIPCLFTLEYYFKNHPNHPFHKRNAGEVDSAIIADGAEAEIFISSIKTPREYKGHGYHFVCFQYFIDEFILKHSNVTHMTTIKNCGTPQVDHPRYAFIQGENEFILHWVRPEENTQQ